MEVINTKLEIRNTKQILMSQIPDCLKHLNLEFRVCFEFRNSNFVLIDPVAQMSPTASKIYLLFE